MKLKTMAIYLNCKIVQDNFKPTMRYFEMHKIMHQRTCKFLVVPKCVNFILFNKTKVGNFFQVFELRKNLFFHENIHFNDC